MLSAGNSPRLAGILHECFRTLAWAFVVGEANLDERKRPRVGKACGMAPTNAQIKVVCRGTERRGTHAPRIVALYDWSDAEAVWERVDRKRSDSDWFIRRLDDGTLQAYPTPRLKCSCGYDPQPSHDELQERLSTVNEELIL